VLAAYAVGLPAVVLIRSAVASFYARSDTATPVLASLIAVGVNIVLKLLLMGPARRRRPRARHRARAWVNLLLLYGLAWRRDWTAPSAALGKLLAAVLVAGAALAAFAILARAPLAEAVARLLSVWREETLLALLGLSGAVLYGAVLLAGVKLFRVPLRRA
jgi:putative peptidoglycan lipid II flippase